MPEQRAEGGSVPSGTRTADQPGVVLQVRPRPATAHVALEWSPVEGALGYVVSRATSAEGPFVLVGGPGPSAAANARPVFADPTFGPDETAPRWYTVAALGAEGPGPASPPVSAAPEAGEAGEVTLLVDASRPSGALEPVWRRAIGCADLSPLLRGEVGWGGAAVAEDLGHALTLARDELGIEHVRTRPELPSAAVAGGEVTPAVLDQVYDRLVELGLRPVVPLGALPTSAVRPLVEHLLERYGAEEVEHWLFEVTAGSVTGPLTERYVAAARAVKAVHAGLRVGGPGSDHLPDVAALLAYAAEQEVPVDVVTATAHDGPPADLRALTRAYALGGHPEPEIWWTRWDVTTGSVPLGDAAASAALTLHAVRAAMDCAQVLASWAISDHAGYPVGVPRLFHGGPGLLTVGNLRKPRFWALRLLGRLGGTVLTTSLEGDGARSLVDALATSDADGRIDLLIWNGAYGSEGNVRLDRRVVVRVEGLRPGTYDVVEERLDEVYGDVVRAWRQLGAPDWPDDAGWRELRASDSPSRWLTGTCDAPEGRIDHLFDLPMPGVRLVSLRPR